MKKALSLLLLLAGLSLPTTSFAQWQILSTGLPDSLLVHAISSPSPDVVWGISMDWGVDFFIEPQPFVVRTTDGGATWTTSQFKDTFSEWAIDIAALDENTAFVISYDFNTGEGSVYRTGDGGASWQELSGAANGIAYDDPYGFPNLIHFWDKRNGIILGDPDESGYFEIYTTRDGGDHWVQTIDPDLLGEGAYGNFNGIGTNGTNTIFFSSSYPQHSIFKSDDRGLTWHKAVSPYEGDTTNFNSITSFVFEDDGRRGLAFTQFNPTFFGGDISGQRPQLRTDDGGETWHPVPTANYADYQERGVGAKVPGADCQYVVGHFNQAVSYSDDCGDSYTYDPTIAGVGLEFYSPTEGWLSLFYLGGTGGEVAKFTGNLSPSTIRNVTFQVDLSGVAVSPAGVHVAVNYFGWSPSAIPMTSTGNGFYEATLQVPTGTNLHYKFINGNSWGQNESVPAGCGVQNSAGSFDRQYTVGQWDARLPVACFNSCIGCGQTAPSGSFYCPAGASQCEIFDAYPAASFPGSGAWTNLSDAASAIVTGYYHGFTNASGGRALHLRQGGDAAYLLNNVSDGMWEISMRVYVPWDKEARIAALANANDPASSLFELPLHTNRTVWQADGMYQNYQQNRWLDLVLSVNMASGEWSATLAGTVVYAGTFSAGTSLAALEFSARSPHGEFFVDDISVRKLGGNFKPSTGVAKSSGAAGIYPNPASDVLFVPFEFESVGDLTLTLTDLAGKAIFSSQLTDTQSGVETVRLEGVASGTYFLKVKHPAGERTERVVLERN